MRSAAAAAMLVALTFWTVGSASGSVSTDQPNGLRGADQTCLAGYSDGRLMCQVEPRMVGIGALGLMRSIEWEFWSPARKITGIGKLRVSGGCCDDGIKSRARIRVGRLRTCGNDVWFTRITIDYGPSFRKNYVDGIPSPSRCD